MKTVVRDLAVIHGSDRASRGGVCHFVQRRDRADFVAWFRSNFIDLWRRSRGVQCTRPKGRLVSPRAFPAPSRPYRRRASADREFHGPQAQRCSAA
jgi:hypothetical protein